MASLTIRGLEESVKQRLRMRAAKHGVSMEEEAREILKVAVAMPESEYNLGDAIHALFRPLGGVDLPQFADEPVGDPINFDE